MKKAEAISILATSARPREPKDRARYDEAVKMAIEALRCSEIPNSSDSISRRAAIDAAKKNTFRLTFAEEQNCEGHVAWSAEAVYSDVMEGALLDLPSAQPDNQINLCDSCDYLYPDCPAKNDDVIFGNGIGNDNICACNKYKPSAQPEQRWIPCSERLPNTNGIYIVTRRISDGFEYRNITDACYFDGSNTWHDDTRVNHGRKYLADVLAWMPLPEPYRGGEK